MKDSAEFWTFLMATWLLGFMMGGILVALVMM